MPTEDVSDLRDVVDAINRLCETMKTSGYEETEYEDCTDVAWSEEAVETSDVNEELVSPEEVDVRKVETFVAEQWSDPSATESEMVLCEPASEMVSEVISDVVSEMYYTASSEVSLLSEAEAADDRRSVMAGHVAAMRERFESMTRANTPCPDLARSLSPSLDLFRNVTPSPDRLDD
ncbi:uncharacterized protein [Battus philenor]|uniref:uncharacterized protein n=1 Tax=Battus philenor TaxID=42288 RepID=UPI0035D05535